MSAVYIQSTIDISNCQGTNKFVRDIESSTYRVFEISRFDCICFSMRFDRNSADRLKKTRPFCVRMFAGERFDCIISIIYAIRIS